MSKRVLVVLSALLLAGCGAVGTPVEPAPVGDVRRPMPANVGGYEEEGGSSPPAGCDATASLSPSDAIAPGSTMAKIRERGRLIVGVDQNTYLFGFRNPTTGKLEGFDIDIARQIANELLGDPNAIQFRAITSAQRIPVLEKGEVDMVVRTFTVNCAREEKINFSSVYFQAGQRVLVDKGSSAKSLADLGDEKVCATKGSTSIKRIAAAESNPIPVSVDNWSDCLVMLQQDQVAAVSTDGPILAGMAAQDPTTHVVGAPISDEPYGIGIPKRNTDMVRYVNAVLEQVRESGAWQASYDRWLASRLGPASPPEPKYE